MGAEDGRGSIGPGLTREAARRPLRERPGSGTRTVTITAARTPFSRRAPDRDATAGGSSSSARSAEGDACRPGSANAAPGRPTVPGPTAASGEGEGPSRGGGGGVPARRAGLPPVGDDRPRPARGTPRGARGRCRRCPGRLRAAKVPLFGSEGRRGESRAGDRGCRSLVPGGREGGGGGDRESRDRTPPERQESRRESKARPVPWRPARSPGKTGNGRRGPRRRRPGRAGAGSPAAPEDERPRPVRNPFGRPEAVRLRTRPWRGRRRGLHSAPLRRHAS